MGILKTGFSAIGKLLMLFALAGTFVVGAVSAVYLSLRGEEVKVPEVTGKDFYASERDIAALGLKLKKRATRYSEEKPNTILEQLPKPGETVKTGQTILVVTSEVNPEGSEAPAVIEKPSTSANNEDENTDITPDKSTKANSNVKTKKPAQSTRDVISNKANANSNAAANVNPGNNQGETKNETGGNKNISAPSNNKQTPPANSNKLEPAAKPAVVVKPTPATSGDVRSRRVP